MERDPSRPPMPTIPESERPPIIGHEANYLKARNEFIHLKSRPDTDPEKIEAQRKMQVAVTGFMGTPQAVTLRDKNYFHLIDEYLEQLRDGTVKPGSNYERALENSKQAIESIPANKEFVGFLDLYKLMKSDQIFGPQEDSLDRKPTDGQSLPDIIPAGDGYYWGSDPSLIEWETLKSGEGYGSYSLRIPKGRDENEDYQIKRGVLRDYLSNLETTATEEGGVTLKRTKQSIDQLLGLLQIPSDNPNHKIILDKLTAEMSARETLQTVYAKLVVSTDIKTIDGALRSVTPATLNFLFSGEMKEFLYGLDHYFECESLTVTDFSTGIELPPTWDQVNQRVRDHIKSQTGCTDQQAAVFQNLARHMYVVSGRAAFNFAGTGTSDDEKANFVLNRLYHFDEFTTDRALKQKNHFHPLLLKDVDFKAFDLFSYLAKKDEFITFRIDPSTGKPMNVLKFMTRSPFDTDQGNIDTWKSLGLQETISGSWSYEALTQADEFREEMQKYLLDPNEKTLAALASKMTYLGGEGKYGNLHTTKSLLIRNYADWLKSPEAKQHGVRITDSAAISQLIHRVGASMGLDPEMTDYTISQVLEPGLKGQLLEIWGFARPDNFIWRFILQILTDILKEGLKNK